MKLVMRGTDIASISWWLLAGEEILEHVTLAARPEEYLGSLSHFLEKSGHKLADITEIIIVNGQGSAAALRASVTLGNTLAWTRGWNIYALTLPAAAPSEAVLENLSLAVRVKLARPVYQNAPHITVATHDALKRKM
jgi:tRNA A37 threonylcarbamoyladenosine modification protein TsaB